MAIQWREWAVLRTPAMGDEAAHMLRVRVFLVTRWDGDPRNLLPGEHDAVAWFTVDDAATLTLAHAEYPRLFREALAVVQ